MRQQQLSGVGLEDLLHREWLATNQLGGYASSTICGMNTRKYHALLVAAMAPPVGRAVLLSRVEETVRVGERAESLATNEYPGVIAPEGYRLLRQFTIGDGPTWLYEGDGWRLEKRLALLPGVNTVCLSYRLLAGPDSGVELLLRPLFALRPIHELTYQHNVFTSAQAAGPRSWRIPATRHTPELFFSADGRFESAPCWYYNTIYRREAERGYSGLEDLWMPGEVRWSLAPGQVARFVCSDSAIAWESAVQQLPDTEPAAAASAGGDGQDLADLDLLVRAAGQFVVQPRDGHVGAMAGYPWSGLSVRDELIGMSGLLLHTGRLAEARLLLLGRAALLRDGLLPSSLAEDGTWRYEAADVSLWWINAVAEYLQFTSDEPFARQAMPTVLSILDAYQAGTALGIRIDPDGLLVVDPPAAPATWMDARHWDQTITPRRGRPIELSALWYNALCIAADLVSQHGAGSTAAGARSSDAARLAAGVGAISGAALDLLTRAQRTRASFNHRFWDDRLGFCYDVVAEHAPDPSLRPNQIFAVSLPYAVLDPQRHALVLERVRAELLTPMGVRTLARGDPAYKGRYAGGPLARDCARHQGSAFPWLLGPLIRAIARVQGRCPALRQEAQRMLRGPLAYLRGRGMGQVCELFDGDPPQNPGGAVASARSIGELLRCYAEEVLDRRPQPRPVITVADITVRPLAGATMSLRHP